LIFYLFILNSAIFPAMYEDAQYMDQ